MFSNKNKTNNTQVAIEYFSPHWVVLIRNPGHAAWTPVKSKSRKVSVQDQFGTVIKTYPAVEIFNTQTEAYEWAQQNVANFEQKAVNKSELDAMFNINATSTKLTTANA